MDHKEGLQDFPVRDLAWVELDLNNLRMTGGAAPHLPVGGIGNAAASVADYHILDPCQRLEDGLQAPETTAAQRGDLDSCPHLLSV